ncbi:MAG: hypothetical protein Q9160_008580 [Pyrenula sp. 1 TL-2023]
MDAQDPFDWTVDRVVEELCHKPTLPGSDTQLIARPDPTALETTLRENDVGGPILLEEVDKNVLKEDFNIRSLGQRIAVEKAIRFLKTQSAKWSGRNQIGPPPPIGGYSPVTPFSQPPRPSFSPRTTYGFSSYRSPLQSYHPFDNAATPSDRDGRPAVPLFNSNRDEPSGTDLNEGGFLRGNEIPSCDPVLHQDPGHADYQVVNEVNSPTVPAKRSRPDTVHDYRDSSIVRSVECNETNDNDGPARTLTGGENLRLEHTLNSTGKRRRIAPTLVTNHSDLLPPNQLRAKVPAEQIHALDSIQTTRSLEPDLPESYYGKVGLGLEDVFYGPDQKADIDTWTLTSKGSNAGTRQYVGDLVKHFFQQQVEMIKGSTAQARVPYAGFRLRSLPKGHRHRQMFTMFPSNEPPVILNAANWSSLRSRGFGPFGRKSRGLKTDEHDSRTRSIIPDESESFESMDEYDQLLERYPPKGEEEDIEVSMAQSVGSLDDETWRELQEEREEDIRSTKTLLSATEVDSVIENCISTMSLTWRERKLFKTARKAFSLWRKADKLGGRPVEIAWAEKRLSRIEQSLIKVKKEVVSHQWTKIEELRSFCQVLEPCVSQREEQRLILTTLQEDSCPPRPEGCRPPPKKARVIDLEDGEEILDSESDSKSEDDGLSDFIEDDTTIHTSMPFRQHTPLEYSESENLHDSFGDRSQKNLGSFRSDEASNFNLDSEIDMDVEYAFADDEDESNDAPHNRANVQNDLTLETPARTKNQSNGPFMPDSNTEEGEMTEEEGVYEDLPNSDSLLGRSFQEDKLSDTERKQTTIPSSKYASRGYDQENAIALSSDGPEHAINSATDVQTPVLSPTTPNIARRKMSNESSRIPSSADHFSLLSTVPEVEYDEAAHQRLLELADKRRERHEGSLDGATLASDGDASARRELQNMEEIKQMTFEELGSTNDHKRLLAKIVYGTPRGRLRKFRDFVLGNDDYYLGAIIEHGLMAIRGLPNDLRGARRYKLALRLAQYYASYANCRNLAGCSKVPERLFQRMLQIAQQPDNYLAFFNTLRTILEMVPKSGTKKKSKLLGSLHKDSLEEKDENKSYEIDPDEREFDLLDAVENNLEAEVAPGATLTPHKKRVRKVAESQDALAAQRRDHLRIQKLELQKKNVHSQMASFESLTDDASRHIIGYEDPLIYLDPVIGRRVKPHQVEGISFMWREIIGDDKRQGCLLAHTMGLGKTMQVISLIVTILLSKQSRDPKIIKQASVIPDTRILILCPPSLIDNWFEEFAKWVPDHAWDALNHCYKITSNLRPRQRAEIIHDWFVNEGVLIISYELLRSIIQNTPARTNGVAPLEEELYERVKKELWEGPSIVVADEAHKMKNDRSAISQVTNKFKSTRRIALTGSPLANNLEEYYAMINWIAPGYLGDIVQFRFKYKEPIEEGLYAESTQYEQRRSLKRLQILKEDLNPKVCRADITAIKQDLPQKTEFFITFGLTKLQKRAYELYVNAILGDAERAGNTRLWDWLFILSLLCSHPSCFHQKISERSADRAVKQKPGASTDDPEGESLPTDVAVKDLGLSTDMIEKQLSLLDEEADLTDPIHSARTDILIRLIDSSLRIKDKVLIFSHNIPTLNYLDRLLKAENISFCRLDGGTSMASRQNTTKQFNQENGRFNVFLISTRAGGLGFNLPGANRVIIFDFGFNPQWEEQAIGRAYRLGQTKPVFVYRFCSAGTFEPIIQNKTIFKTQLSARVVDKKNPMRAASKKVSDYVFRPKEEPREDFHEVIGKDPEVLDPLLGHQAIKNIVLTETFQKELEETLTAEEQKEVRQELEDEKMKRENPKAFEAVLARRITAKSPRKDTRAGIPGLERQDVPKWDPVTLQEMERRRVEAAVNYWYQQQQIPPYPGARNAPMHQATSHFAPNRQPSPPLNGTGKGIEALRASSQGPGISSGSRNIGL